MAKKLFDRYGFSAFFSYATLDDEGQNAFVSCFADELNLALPGRVRGLKLRDVYLPSVHLSGDKPLVAGRLGAQLRANVADSFAMFIFVHANYIESEWCLKELEYFTELFEGEGFRDRLYVIAMSGSAVDELTAGDHWKRLCPFEDQVWAPFFREDDVDKPLGIYSTRGRNARTIIDSEFWARFDPIVTSLAEKIRDFAQAAPKVVPYPVNRADVAAGPADRHLVRVYIESDPAQNTQHESLGAEVESSWNALIDARGIDPRLYLRPSGLAMSDIDQRPRLDDADGVVLLWNDKTPASVAAQIRKVEPKLVGPRPAPGLIAYVMRESDDLFAGASIFNWKVVRFRVDGAGAISVVPEDRGLLTAFLESVLARKGSIPASAVDAPDPVALPVA